MNILIIDDERAVVNHISEIIIKNYPELSVISYLKSEELISDIKNIRMVDIAFIDIRLPAINGIEVGTYLQTQFPAVKIIFISGHPDYVSEIFFNVQPYGFLEKPIRDDKIGRYIDKILANEQEEISFALRGNTMRIKVNNILWLESNRKTISVITTDGMRNITGKLSETEPLLPGCFVRCHQSFIVNMKYVIKCDLREFTMIDGKTISISRSYKEQALNKYYAFRGNLL